MTMPTLWRLYVVYVVIKIICLYTCTHYILHQLTLAYIDSIICNHTKPMLLASASFIGQTAVIPTYCDQLYDLVV